MTIMGANNKALFNRIKNIQLLGHPSLFKVYEVYILDDKYYIISIYTGTDNLLEKMKIHKTEEEPIIKTIINQI